MKTDLRSQGGDMMTDLRSRLSKRSSVMRSQEDLSSLIPFVEQGSESRPEEDEDQWSQTSDNT